MIGCLLKLLARRRLFEEVLFGATFQQSDVKFPDVPTSIDLGVQKEVKTFRESTFECKSNHLVVKE